MKWTLIMLMFSYFLSCQGQNITISSIERRVYTNDTLHSATIANFEDTGKLFLQKSEEAIKGLENPNLDTIAVSGKYIVYNILLSDDTKKSVKTYRPKQQVDNLMRFDGGIDGDETFEIEWWFKEDEIETIIIPSSDFHK